MSASETFDTIVADHLRTVQAFHAACGEVVAAIAAAGVKAIEGGGKICFFGNGGSAADAQHLAAELVVRYTRNRRALAAIAFTTDTSILTAGANDFGYDTIFARQVEALCRPGDVVVGISTSGTSTNVVRGLEAARNIAGLVTVAFTGENGGRCAELADHALMVPSSVTARVQECHLLAGHAICDVIELAFA